MKIAIISLPLSYNYGGYLQCYALMETLRKMGHEPFFIQRESEIQTSRLKRTIDKAKSLFEKYGLSKIVDLFEICTNSGLFYKTRNFRIFTKKYIKNISPILYSSEDISIYCHEHIINAYITGSDQIWRCAYSRSISDAYLGFAPYKARKISYAPSFGIDVWEYNTEQTYLINQLLNTFHAISVREYDGVKLMKENLSISQEPCVVLDPTFLISVDHYKHIAEGQINRSGALTYMLNLDELKSDAINKMKSIMNTFSVINPLTNTSTIKGSQGYSVEQWLAGFRDADIVLTDSYHAIVFSIIFNKPFWVFENEKRGNSRINNILYIFGCEDRFIKKGTNLNEFNWMQKIDWEQINVKKNKMKQDSLSFLKCSLKE